MKLGRVICSTLFIVAALPGISLGEVLVRSATGDLSAVTVARDEFRADIGGGTSAGANGSFGGIRREIN